MSYGIDLIDGPCKFELEKALFVWKPTRHKVTFKTESRVTVVATINGCTAEDGSGESWILTGYGRQMIVGGTEVSLLGSSKSPFKAYFSTATRLGWIKFD